MQAQGQAIVVKEDIESIDDDDGEGVADVKDNCPEDDKTLQADTDFEGVGDV